MPNEIVAPFELTDAELDAVSGGQLPVVGDAVNVGGIQVAVSALNGNTVTLQNILNHNTVNVPIGVAVAILGGAAGTGLVNKLGGLA